MTFNIPSHLTGLTSDEVLASQKKHGFNKINAAQKRSWVSLLLDILKEPMLLLTLTLGHPKKVIKKADRLLIFQ